MKPSLTILTDCFPPRWDGIARYLIEIIPYLKTKFKLTLITPDYGDYYIPDVQIHKVNIIKTKGYSPAFTFKIGEIKEIIKKTDLVFIQTTGFIGRIGFKYAKKYNKQTINYIHSLEWELIGKRFKNRAIRKLTTKIIKKSTLKILKNTNLIISPSEDIKEKLKWFKIPTPIKIAHLGVNKDKFKPAENKEQEKLKLNIDPKNIVIGYHGRISPEKDLLTLLRAFTRLNKIFEDIKLLIIGSGTPYIRRKFENKENIIILPEQSEVEKYVKIMDIYCLTSQTETTSLSTLEAMSCEVAVICTKVGFVKYYIENEKNGLFFESSNSYDLIRKITKLIKDEKLRKELGKNARKTILENFNWHKTGTKITNILYEEYLKNQ